MDIHALKDIAFDIVVGCSVAHTFLPPWDAEAIAQFPAFQKWYKLFVYLIGYVALNARSSVYKSISTKNPESMNASAETIAKAVDVPILIVPEAPKP